MVLGILPDFLLLLWENEPVLNSRLGATAKDVRVG